MHNHFTSENTEKNVKWIYNAAKERKACCGGLVNDGVDNHNINIQGINLSNLK